MGLVVWTVGHSNGPPEDMIGSLRKVGIDVVADIRTVPRSRRVPWASDGRLPALLAAVGVGYVHLPELGGLRKPRPDSLNGGWRNESFRGYADHMQGEDFARGLSHVLDLARSQRVALMCAESVPWRCHRSLVADALVARGVEVRHLVGGRERPHRMTPFARVEGVRITYPAAAGAQTTLEVDEGAESAASQAHER